MTERASYGAGLAALRPGGVAITEEALSHLLIDTDTRLLDIGCGRGESLAWVQQRFGCHCAGVDLAADYAAQAAAACPAADIRQGDAGKLPFAAASFDIVLLECVFSLLQDTDAALREIRRVLVPGGSLVLSDVYARAEGVRFDAVQPDVTQPLLYMLPDRDVFAASLEQGGFQLLYFADHSDSLLQMLGQMILDGSACACLSAQDLARLRRARAGYALWIWRKVLP